MTISAIPGSVFVANLESAPTGLVGTLTVAIYDPINVVYPTPAQTSGIAETPASSGLYYATLTAPTVAGTYSVIWDNAGTYISEDLVVSYSALTGGSLYLTLPELKSTLTMNGTTFADADLTLAISAASRAVDSITSRRFWLDSDATKVRYYTPVSDRMVKIDDLVTLTSVQVDLTGGGTYSDAWTLGTDFVLEPFNAPSEQPPRPYGTIRTRLMSGRWFPTYIEQSVKVTGQFGWSTVPDDVAAATGILASKLLRRSREAPFGIVTSGLDGVAMRIGRTDPEVELLLRDYVRFEYV